jgi:hypothetical protein
MAIIVGDRVQETSTTTGTGTLSLAGAVSKFRTFVAGIGDGKSVYYSIVHRSSAEWETGIGDVSDASPDTLTRDVVLASSNANALVDFSAGTKDVFCSFPADGVPQGRGFIDGFQMSNATDTDHDIQIGVGECKDSANLVMMRGNQLVKQIDAAWAAGTAAGGMFTGTVGNGTWYHVHAIRKDSDGSVDYGFDTSITAANKPAGYSYYRRIGSVRANGSANIFQFFQIGDNFLWKNLDLLTQDVSNGTLPTSSQTSVTLNTPPGVNVIANLRMSASGSVSVVGSAQYPSVAYIQPHQTSSPLCDVSDSVHTNYVCNHLYVLTDTSSQVAFAGQGASTRYDVTTLGWIDFRGKQ